MRNKVPFILMLIGGLCLLYQGVGGSIGFLQMLDQLQTISELAEYYWIVEILLYVLLLIASLGGISVIIGGYLMTTDRFGTGKFVVGLGAGMSLIGLIIAIVQLYWAAFGSGASVALVDIMDLLPQGFGVAGVILSIIGRQTAKKPE